MTLSLPTPRPSSLPALTDAQPTEAETAVWNQVSAVLEEAHGILAELQSYNGAGQEIREVSINQSLQHGEKLALMCDARVGILTCSVPCSRHRI